MNASPAIALLRFRRFGFRFGLDHNEKRKQAKVGNWGLHPSRRRFAAPQDEGLAAVRTLMVGGARHGAAKDGLYWFAVAQ
jgi:hypothetical protein